VNDLAARLQVSPELTLAMLECLEKMGYLHQIDGTCVESCTSCSMASFCAADEREKKWTLTEKATIPTACHVPN
jgi:hypothetical protein